MADEPTGRRRRSKTTEPRAAGPAVTEGAAPEPSAKLPKLSKVPGPPEKPFNLNVVWALVTGLAVGFAVGREAHRFGLSDTKASEDPSAVASADLEPPPAPAVKGYAHFADFPADWVKEGDLANGATLLAGLDEAHKVAVMQALNERTCNCGCAFGTLAHCLQKDPNCPNSPAMAKLAVGLAKQGQGLAEILAAIDAKDSAPKPEAAPEPPAVPHYIEPEAWNPRKGPSSAKVTVVAFSDFQCPFCKRAAPILKQIEDQYGKDVTIVFKNQPLPFHDKAMGAALALQAANRQKKGWAMHDKMFENNTALTREDLDKYAKEIGLDMAKFAKDMGDPKLAEEVAADQKIGNAVGASGTPTFFVNGHQIVGAQPFEKFKAMIDEEIKAADELIKGGTPLADVYKKRAQ